MTRHPQCLSAQSAPLAGWAPPPQLPPAEALAAAAWEASPAGGVGLARHFHSGRDTEVHASPCPALHNILI